MAVKTLSENINQAISDLNGVKQALIDKGVEIPSGTKTSEYGAKIGEIQSGGGGSEITVGFVPTETNFRGFPTKGILKGLTEVPDYYFYCNASTSYRSSYSTLKDITFEQPITTIYSYAFHYCIQLALTSLPSSVTNIYQYSFYYCKKLALTSIPNSVTTIGEYAFRNCTGLTTLSIGSKIISISSNAFTGCTNLTSITVNKKTGSPSGSPWGATNATVYWVG